RPMLVAYHRGRASLDLELGNIDDAIAALDAGLDAASAEPSLALERAYLIATLAQATARFDPERSALQLGEALALFGTRVPNSHPVMLRVINERCALEVRAGDTRATHCEDARVRAARTREVDPALRAAVLGNLSELEKLRGNLREASDLA